MLEYLPLVVILGLFWLCAQALKNKKRNTVLDAVEKSVSMNVLNDTLEVSNTNKITALPATAVVAGKTEVHEAILRIATSKVVDGCNIQVSSGPTKHVIYLQASSVLMLLRFGSKRIKVGEIDIASSSVMTIKQVMLAAESLVREMVTIRLYSKLSPS